MQLFHYHLVTSKVREVEARYVGKLGFGLVARHGRIEEDTTSFESGHGWEELDRIGFKLRLTELERGAVNVVVQPGQWELPRLDHIGFALDEDDFVATLARADMRELRIQEHGGRRTFVTTNAGVKSQAAHLGYLKTLEEAGVTLLEGVCFYILQNLTTMRVANGWTNMISNSAKIVNIIGAHKFNTILRRTQDCVDIACTGRLL